MKQLSNILLYSVFAVVMGCGSENNDKDSVSLTIDELFPADNEIGDWAEDMDEGNPGVEVAHNDKEVVVLINGAADPFMDHGFIAFGLQDYISESVKLHLHIWEMNNAKVAGDLYSNLPDTVTLYGQTPWEEVDVGQKGRITDTGTKWWVNVRNGSYYVEVVIESVTDEARSDALKFAKHVVSKL